MPSKEARGMTNVIIHGYVSVEVDIAELLDCTLRDYIECNVSLCDVEISDISTE